MDILWKACGGKCSTMSGEPLGSTLREQIIFLQRHYLFLRMFFNLSQ